jgi:hypothetical protein
MLKMKFYRNSENEGGGRVDADETWAKELTKQKEENLKKKEEEDAAAKAEAEKGGQSEEDKAKILAEAQQKAKEEAEKKAAENGNKGEGDKGEEKGQEKKGEEAPESDTDEFFKIPVKEKEKEKEKPAEPADKDVEALKAKASFYDELESDPILKSVIEARKQGKDVYEVLEKYKPVDVTKISADQLTESYLKEQIDLLAKYESGEELEASVEELKDKFNSLDKPQKYALLEQQRSKIAEAEAKKIEALKDNPLAQPAYDFGAISKKAQADLNDVAKQSVGKVFEGVELTQDIVSRVVEQIQGEDAAFVGDPLNPDAKKVFVANLKLVLFEDSMKLAEKRGMKKAREEHFNERTRPSDYTTKTPPTKISTEQKERSESLASAWKNL